MRAPGAFRWQDNTDVRCPTCHEMVNVACWRGCWTRDPEERKATLAGEATPLWHGARLRTERQQRQAMERRRMGWPRMIQALHDESCR